MLSPWTSLKFRCLVNDSDYVCVVPAPLQDMQSHPEYYMKESTDRYTGCHDITENDMQTMFWEKMDEIQIFIPKILFPNNSITMDMIKIFSLKMLTIRHFLGSHIVIFFVMHNKTLELLITESICGQKSNMSLKNC